MNEMTISKSQLQEALQQWEQSARDGDWQRDPAKPVDEIAAESADYLWGLLGQPVTA